MSQNPPVDPTVFSPRNFVVTNITNAIQSQVTTSAVNDYVVGQLVRMHVPRPYGMHQIDNLSGYIISIQSSTQFTTDINTLFFDSFVASPTYPGNTSPQVTAIGDKNLNSATTSNNGPNISGAFQQTA
jgi:hypothetical protein